LEGEKRPFIEAKIIIQYYENNVNVIYKIIK